MSAGQGSEAENVVGDSRMPQEEDGRAGVGMRLRRRRGFDELRRTSLLGRRRDSTRATDPIYSAGFCGRRVRSAASKADASLQC